MLTDDDIADQLATYFNWLDADLGDGGMPALRRARDGGPSPVRPRRLSLAAVTAGLLIVLLVGGLLWSRGSGGEETGPGTVSPATSVDLSLLAAESPVEVPDSAMLRIARDSPVGRFEIYDDPEAATTYFFLRRPDLVDDLELIQGGRLSDSEIAAGSWSIHGDTDEPRLMYGLFPEHDGYSVSVSGETTVPDEYGIWYTSIDADTTEFTINRPEGAIIITLDQPGTDGG